MFGPTASPVVHDQRTWHMGPTTCVFTSRSRARVESSGRGADASHSRIAGTSPSSQRASATASPALLQTKQDALVILSRIMYVRNPPDSAAAFAPRWREAERPPSVCASGTNTSSSARPRSASSPSGSASSYSPSSTVTGTTATGISAAPVSASWAPAQGVRSWAKTSPSTGSASWRARIDSGSFFRGQRRVTRGTRAARDR
jgi:hypothetical protein